ncbi:citrate lyase holo-[acyl-carrier protein] synthase [Vibrio panuliri]|uniref:citrate lyase holo-[acyl-carrier protein] synthase n=1 Tax=Vibrio panuliri TaxID=1381081 RepID=A0ABX3F9N7_9VIBR|nr:citrate lyase holo-[acyl-carrier protein] synthase [Vibrio panuliri]OLQ87703.1 hypothetical protein BIY20_13405 [Vibrio panuliri]
MDSVSPHEQYHAQREKFLSHYRLPIVTLKLNLPNELNHKGFAQSLFESALNAFEQKLNESNIQIADKKLFPNASHQAMFSVQFHSITLLKKLMMQLERDHPWGALFNFDVTSEQGETLSRRSAYMQPRRCIICSEPMQTCIATKRHTVTEVEQAVVKLMAMGD